MRPLYASQDREATSAGGKEEAVVEEEEEEEEEDERSGVHGSRVELEPKLG